MCGADLACVRYRYDDDWYERINTVEIVIDRSESSRRRHDPDEAVVRFKLEGRWDLLGRAVMFTGGHWDERTDACDLPRHAAAQRLLTRTIGRSRRRRPPK